MVKVPRQNSMRLPETATPVITISRTANTSTASTSRAGLLVQAQNVDGSRSRHRTQDSLRSTPFERIGRSLSCRKQNWQCHLTERNQQRWSATYDDIRQKERFAARRNRVGEDRYEVKNVSRFRMTEEQREQEKMKNKVKRRKLF